MGAPKTGTTYLQDRLALGFILDVSVALVILTVYFAKHPLGPVRWPWFVLLSFMGGLGFSLPLYYWLNQRRLSSQTAAQCGQSSQTAP